ncbi:maltose alpha-D-glucosyltransferase/alpha-amylase [Rhodoferax ferrireducens]|uniref:Maltose alpha-D-glucosyltransferase/alpha-amylase n=1 Tax=Rhodoferax ferrireducens TaxID=192843 RepID=A0ABU2C6G3_9BURK|nr:alpha-amylase family glycosyl hydrolase [Rhodoferax ferrireducens]MDR7376934.1 maltose alpha-D-glucosyltransferase/alpha-amylase [Rhodoferax ferrireducens]
MHAVPPEKMRLKLQQLWQQLYPDQPVDQLEPFFTELQAAAQAASPPPPATWFKEVVVYSLYVDLFNQDFQGLTTRLGYLQDLGVTCLWLLPILDSPMRDAGFDISDYTKIRSELVGGSDAAAQATFGEFLAEAHRRGIRVIFDVAMNHCSDQHHWFQEARKGPDNPYRDYFIWSDTTERYKEARIIFKGMMPSNWHPLPEDPGTYFFHRFFDSQPDLNYRNPEVLLAMCRVLLFWVAQGVDGFRADAIPYLWKEEGTICENLPGTHTIVKFFRAVLDAVRPGTILLAEACQPPAEVVTYFGDSDECQAAYHFPVMPRIYLALAQGSAKPIFETLSTAFTPEIPADCGWFSFLRCHDELTLEMVTPAERKAIHAAYCLQPEWDFRQGEGIASRLVDLFRHDPAALQLAFSISFTLLGTPVVFYGDEFAKPNDEQFQREQEALTGYQDARYRVRGAVDWPAVDAALADPASLPARTHAGVRAMLAVRRAHPALSGGSFQPLAGLDDRVLAYVRGTAAQRVLVVQNLSADTVNVAVPGGSNWRLIYGTHDLAQGVLTLPPKGFSWFAA